VSVATTIGVVVLVFCLVVIAVLQKARTVGPMVNVGVLLGLGAGVSATALLASLLT
jgi:hypothetical protein